MSNEFFGDTKWHSSSSLFIDQSMLHDKVKESTNRVASVFAVATMWHENSDEMLSILESIFRMDKDQSLRRSDRYHNTNKVMELHFYCCLYISVVSSREYIQCVCCIYQQIIDPHFYHYETHIFFDDAFESHTKDGTTSRIVVNCFVNQWIELMDCKLLTNTNDNQPGPRQAPFISVTPYGGRLEWTLPGSTKMTVHLKDKNKIRNKKRWSQVMYIDYLMRYEIGNHFDLENTYLLTLDGDMDFRPKAVHILMDMMNCQPDVAIACNRSHPTGSPGK